MAPATEWALRFRIEEQSNEPFRGMKDDASECPTRPVQGAFDLATRRNSLPTPAPRRMAEAHHQAARGDRFQIRPICGLEVGIPLEGVVEPIKGMGHQHIIVPVRLRTIDKGLRKGQKSSSHSAAPSPICCWPEASKCRLSVFIPKPSVSSSAVSGSAAATAACAARTVAKTAGIHGGLSTRRVG